MGGGVVLEETFADETSLTDEFDRFCRGDRSMDVG